MGRATNRLSGRSGEAATGLFKVTGRASLRPSSPAACWAHRRRLGSYATPVAGLPPRKGVVASEGCFLLEVVTGPGFGGWNWVAARPGRCSVVGNLARPY